MNKATAPNVMASWIMRIAYTFRTKTRLISLLEKPLQGSSAGSVSLPIVPTGELIADDGLPKSACPGPGYGGGGAGNWPCGTNPM